MARKINRAGLELIKSFEGLRLVAYDDLEPKRKLKPGDKLKGTLTIGHGHTGPDVFIGQKITAAEAEELLRIDLAEAEADVERSVTAETNDNEFSALVSFAFNCGAGNLKKLVAGRLNKGDRAATARAFMLYNKSKGKEMPGLTRRRAAEAALFLKPVGAEARSTATTTPDDVKASMSGSEKATAGVAGGGIAAGGAVSLWDSAVEAVKDNAEWTWSLPAKVGAAILAGAVLAAVWLWWKRRRKVKAA